jgi:hypothetical protein
MSVTFPRRFLVDSARVGLLARDGVAREAFPTFVSGQHVDCHIQLRGSFRLYGIPELMPIIEKNVSQSTPFEEKSQHIAHLDNISRRG